MPPTYSLLVPIFNEEAVIAVLLKRLDALLEALDAPARGDPSRRWFSRLTRARDRGQGARRQALLADQLSRNFGHQIAIMPRRRAGRFILSSAQ
jgi:polyisoprenyl-phosphate glycosyltransferase